MLPVFSPHCYVLVCTSICTMYYDTIVLCWTQKLQELPEHGSWTKKEVILSFVKITERGSTIQVKILNWFFPSPPPLTETFSAMSKSGFSCLCLMKKTIQGSVCFLSLLSMIGKHVFCIHCIAWLGKYTWSRSVKNYVSVLVAYFSLFQSYRWAYHYLQNGDITYEKNSWSETLVPAPLRHQISFSWNHLQNNLSWTQCPYFSSLPLTSHCSMAKRSFQWENVCFKKDV